MSQELTDDQYKEIAKQLGNTSRNVIRLARDDYDYEWADEDFDKLKKVAGVFKCENCDQWKDTSEEDRAVHDFCTECVDDL